MKFDKAAYSQAKERIVALIKNNHDWENTEGFIADGVICPKVYEKQPVRILCILAESYGYEKSGMTDIETQQTVDVLGLGKASVKTPRRLGTLLHLLQRSLENGAKVTPEEWKQAPRLLASSDEGSVAILQDALSKVGWINVKKASNGDGTKLVSTGFRDHASRNREILRQQIEAIAPHLIIVCGESAFRSLHEMGLLGPETKLGCKWQVQNSGIGPRVIEVTHPGYYRWANYDYIYQTFEGIYGQIRL